MPLVDKSTFVTRLGKLLDDSLDSGSIFITFTQVPGSQKVKGDIDPSTSSEPRCLVRATDGSSGRNKIKFSTIVAAKDVESFNKLYALIIKSHVVNMKKEKKKKKATSSNMKE